MNHALRSIAGGLGCTLALVASQASAEQVVVHAVLDDYCDLAVNEPTEFGDIFGQGVDIGLIVTCNDYAGATLSIASANQGLLYNVTGSKVDYDIEISGDFSGSTLATGASPYALPLPQGPTGALLASGGGAVLYATLFATSVPDFAGEYNDTLTISLEAGV